MAQHENGSISRPALAVDRALDKVQSKQEPVVHPDVVLAVQQETKALSDELRIAQRAASEQLFAQFTKVLCGSVTKQHRYQDASKVLPMLADASPDPPAFADKVARLRATGCPKLPEFLHMLYHAMYVDKNRDFLMAALSSTAVRRVPAALHAPSTIHNQQQQQQHLQHQPPLQPQGGRQHSAGADAGQLPARHSQANGDQEGSQRELYPLTDLSSQRDRWSSAEQLHAQPTPSSATPAQLHRQTNGGSSAGLGTPTGQGMASQANGHRGDAALLQTPSGPQPLSTRRMAGIRSNPMWNQESMSPLRTSSAYEPRLAGALPGRTLRGDQLQPALAGIDSLMAPQPQLPPGLALPPVPQLPEWSTSRPLLTGSFLFEPAPQQADARQQQQQQLETFSAAVQELLVLDDLLFCMMGWEGKYIKLQWPGSNHGLAAKGPGEPATLCYAVDGQMDSSLHELVDRILPLCASVVVVQRFVETRSAFEWGRVCHALAAAMRRVLADWQLMVTQLEHQLRTGQLTLQALWYYCQPPMASLQLLAGLATEAAQRRLRGSGLLDLLWERAGAVAGDVQAHGLLQRLLRAACEPYFGSLERWLSEGTVEDPYAEFMVQENVDIGRDSLSADEQSAFWYHRYLLRPVLDAEGQPVVAGSGEVVHEVPCFLAGSKAAILTTGKYLNAMRECGRALPRPLPAGTRIAFDPEGGRHETAIQAAFAAASTALLTLLHSELGLPGTLAALRQYLLLAQGDLLGAFLDSAEEELAKPAPQVSVIRLQSLLDLAVRSSSVAGDPHSERLLCVLDHRSMLGMLRHIFQRRDDADTATLAVTHYSPAVKASPLKPQAGGEKNSLKSKLGREAFLLGYKVEWPLSIVVSQQAMTQYQLIFRHLFELKHVERQLNGVWQLYQTTRGLFRWTSGTLQRCYSLCQQMMHFFRQYLLYVTFEVLEPLWAVMSQQCRQAATVDEVIGHHREFLRRLMKGCLLSRKVPLLRALMELKSVASKFAAYSAVLQVDTDSIDAEQAAAAQRGPPQPSHVRRGEKAAAVAALLQSVVSDERFSGHVAEVEAQFAAKLHEFISGLQDVHRSAQRDASESREELDGLLNLIYRLDSGFNPSPTAQQLVQRLEGAGGSTSSSLALP